MVTKIKSILIALLYKIVKDIPVLSLGSHKRQTSDIGGLDLLFIIKQLILRKPNCGVITVRFEKESKRTIGSSANYTRYGLVYPDIEVGILLKLAFIIIKSAIISAVLLDKFV